MTHESAPLEKTLDIVPVKAHLLQSEKIEQAFEIQVAQPLRAKGDESPLPSLYFADANEVFHILRGISLALQAAGEVSKFNIVGIGYPGECPYAGDLLRARDLTSDDRPPIPDFPEASPIEGVAAIPPGKRRWGGAAAFATFLEEAVFPFVETNYLAKPRDRAYFGHSFGAGFGLFCMFSRASPFNRYILSSPGLIWDGVPHGLAQVQRFIESRKALDATLFLSVGGEEEFQDGYARSQFCTSHYLLSSLLHRSSIEGLTFTSRLFPGETHASAMPISFIHGLKSIFPAGEDAWGRMSGDPQSAGGAP